jgi:class 3 adenylate cyclase/tetratricopeptide (TPR) repeat protein
LLGCPGCGERNPERARFCLGCGAPLAASVAAVRERRVVTVLFADLVGFTTLSERLSPEDISLIQDAYFQGVRETVSRYGGRVEKFIGDAAMAVFGLPRSRENDAERAVRAGLALVNSVERSGARLGLSPGELRLRVGINTGEVVHARDLSGDWRVTGDAVNISARLQASALPGRVLVGEATALTVAAAAVMEPPVALDLKGKSEPVRAALVVEMRSEESRDHAMGQLHAPLLGRKQELTRLVDALQRTAAGASERWLIVAPPGVGKTRLLEAVVEQAVASAAQVVLRARIPSEGRALAQPVAALIRGALAYASGDAPDTRPLEDVLGERLAAAGLSPRQLSSVAADTLEILRPHHRGTLVGQRTHREPRELFLAWSVALDALLASASLWIIEDIHQASPDLLAFLDFAAGHRGRSGRLILVTARSSILETAPEWCRPDPGRAEVLHLATLDPLSIGEVVRALVGGALPDDLFKAVASRSGGNPLFVEELLRSWVSAGALTHAGGVWRLSVAAQSVPLPVTVQGIYASQLDDLPSTAREVVRRAAVAGDNFPFDALAQLGVDGPAAGIEVLLLRAFITGPVWEPVLGPSYRFRHALLQEAGYASLARSDRAKLHARLAAWLETRAGEYANELSEVIGGHYAAALAASPSLAGEVDTNLDRATAASRGAAWLERAGDASLAIAARKGAIGLFRRSLDLTPVADFLDRTERQLKLAEAQRRGGELEAALESFRQSADGARWVRSVDLLAKSAIGYEDALFSSRLPRQPAGDASIAMLQDAASRLEGDTVPRALVLAALARAQTYSGHASEAELMFGQSLDIARSLGDPRTLAYAIFARRAALSEPQHISVRMTDEKEMIDAAVTGGDQELEIEGRRHLMMDQLEAGEVDAAIATTETLGILIESLGRPIFLWYPAMWRAMLALFRGSAGQAEQLVADFLTAGEQWQYREVDEVHLAQLFVLRRGQGRLDELADRLQRNAIKNPPRWASARLLQLTESGQRKEAGTYFGHLAAEEFAALPNDLSLAFNLALLAETCALLGDRRAASQLYERLHPWVGLNIVLGSGAVCLGAASYYLGLLAETSGDRAGALTHFEEARHQNRRMLALTAATRSGHALARALLAGTPAERVKGHQLLSEVESEIRMQGLWLLAAARAADSPPLRGLATDR